MNKILIALLSLFALVACGDNEEKPVPQPEKAQPQLALSYQDKVYPSGSTIDIAATERVFDYAPGEIEVKAGDDHPDFSSPSPVIVLNATGDHKAEATKLPLNYTATVTTTDFARFTWCGVAPECAPMTKATELVRHFDRGASPNFPFARVWLCAKAICHGECYLATPSGW